jgi:MATE family multidrug resistance protein
MFGFLALRFSSEGIGWTRPIMYMAVGAFIVNLALNYVLMTGRYGAPALGAVGCGVATSTAEWLLFLAMFVYVRRHRRYREFAPLARFERPQSLHLGEILGLGLPIAGSLLAEGGLFSAAGLIMGTLGATVVAAHAIGISCASLIFMLPLSVHSATTIHVGHRAGAGRWQDARRAGWVGIAMCVSFMCCSCVALLLLRQSIAELYTRDPAVLAIAVQLLLYAGFFQVADGLQVGAAGALRGFKDARVPMLLNILAYWGIGFPLAWYFGLRAGQGAAAVWLGLIAGLLVCAVLLTIRYSVISRHAVRNGGLGPP